MTQLHMYMYALLYYIFMYYIIEFQVTGITLLLAVIDYVFIMQFGLFCLARFVVRKYVSQVLQEVSKQPNPQPIMSYYRIYYRIYF